MTKLIILFNFLSIFSLVSLNANEEQDYNIYHQQVIEAEKLIAFENYANALQVYQQLFSNYDFVFLREYQIATQLSLFLNGKQNATKYLKQGMLAGWEMKSIKRNEYLAPLRKDEDWKSIKKEYHKLREQYETSINQKLRKRVKKMFSKDQWKAFGAIFTFSSKAQDRYAEKRFAPQSEKQMVEISDILETYGYPGEKLIGNDYWASTIVSHHNSISQEYVKNDTLYLNMKPKLWDALSAGQISPFEFALMDDWYRSTIDGNEKITYGILEQPSQSELSKTNELRKTAYLKPIELRNKLVEIQEKTGMDFYLSDSWY